MGSEIIIEQNQRLAKSLLWKLQRAFYVNRGIEAWSQVHVPHYITNNPVIAGKYAHLAAAFLRDCMSGGTTSLDPAQPVYIIELGAGSGRFAFHFLNRFLPVLKNSQLKDLQVVYVLSDLPERNVEFWESHPKLAPFVAAGQLDFACYDPSNDDAISLRRSGKQLGPGSFANPFIVLANYFFDSIPQDAFYVNQGMLCEELTTLASDHPRLANDDPEILPHLRVRFDPHFTSLEYFNDPDFNAILRAYLRLLNQSYLQFPTGALEVLRRLCKLSDDRLLLLASDRGYFQPDALRQQEEPRIYLHGSAFSMQVNFHAMAQYIELRGGKALMANHREEGLVTSAFLLGLRVETCLETPRVFNDVIDNGGPDDFFVIKKAVEPLLDQFNLEQLLALLRLSRYDPNIFEKCCLALLRLAPEASEQQFEQLYTVTHRVWDAYYPIGEGFDLALALGRIYLAMACYADAEECLTVSLQSSGPNAETQALLEQCRKHTWNEG